MRETVIDIAADVIAGLIKRFINARSKKERDAMYDKRMKGLVKHGLDADKAKELLDMIVEIADARRDGHVVIVSLGGKRITIDLIH